MQFHLSTRYFSEHWFRVKTTRINTYSNEHRIEGPNEAKPTERPTRWKMFPELGFCSARYNRRIHPGSIRFDILQQRARLHYRSRIHGQHRVSYIICRDREREKETTSRVQESIRCVQGLKHLSVSLNALRDSLNLLCQLRGCTYITHAYVARLFLINPSSLVELKRYRKEFQTMGPRVNDFQPNLCTFASFIVNSMATL